MLFDYLVAICRPDSWSRCIVSSQDIPFTRLTFPQARNVAGMALWILLSGLRMIKTCLSLTISRSYSLTFPLIIFYLLCLHNSIPKSSATNSVHPQALCLYIPWNFVWIRHVGSTVLCFTVGLSIICLLFSGWVELVNQNTFVTMTHSPSIYYALSQSTYCLWFAKMLVSSLHLWSIHLHPACGVESYIFICSCHIVLQWAP